MARGSGVLSATAGDLREARTLTNRELAAEAINERRAHQKPAELESLIALVRERRPRTVVEIGTHEGGTLYALCQAADPEAMLVSIDLPGGMWGGGYSRREARRFRGYAQPGQALHTLRRNSQKPRTVRKLRSLLDGRGIDFLMIDGDHSYEGVKRDWELYEPLVSSGGVIAFHDVIKHPPETMVEVDRFWSELVDLQPTDEFTDPGHDRGQGPWGGIGVVFKQS